MQFPHLTNKEDRAFAAHLLDLLELANRRHITRFTAFLDLNRLTIARQVTAGADNVLFYGGHPHAERMMLGVFAPYEPPTEDAFPISPITARFRKEDAIGHRDFLGSLVGLKLNREVIGDILVGEGQAVFFVTEATKPLVLTELTKIGRWGVSLSAGLPEQLPALHDYADLHVHVSSLRLDGVVSAVTGASREKSAGMIQSQLVSVNGAVQQQGSRTIAEGDIISIRGFGKVLFAQTERVSKKGRLQLLCKKYQ